MKSVAAIAGQFVCLTVGFVITQQRDADAHKATTAQVSAPDGQSADVLITEPEAEPKKKCSFNSDCKYGKCSKGKCGACGFKSDCNGWGTCSKGQCGACGFDSDCKGFGKCSGGKCTKSPY